MRTPSIFPAPGSGYVRPARRGFLVANGLATCLHGLLIAISLVLPAVSAVAQSNGSGQVTARIPAVGFIDLAGNGAATELLKPAQTGAVSVVQVRVHSGASSRVVIPLLLRSNGAYQLFVRTQPLKSALRQPITASPVLIEPNHGGRRVMTEGSRGYSSTAVLRSLGQEDLLLTGSRISRGGNNSTTDNALLVQVEVTLPDDVSEADFLFSLRIQ